MNLQGTSIVMLNLICMLRAGLYKLGSIMIVCTTWASCIIRFKLKVATAVFQSHFTSFIHQKKKNAWKRKTFVLFVQKWENVSVLSILTIWLFLVLADHPRVRRGQKSRWRWREKKQREGGRGSGREGQRWRVHGNDPAAAGSPRHGEDGGVRTQGKDHSNTQVCTLY